MCGIVGYVGFRPAQDVLLQGLRRMEYRGYDSAGVATIAQKGKLFVSKAAGRIENLAAQLDGEGAEGNIGIGHTRWATHGPPTDVNAHPHLGGDVLAVVHNGVIENFQAIKSRLIAKGYSFKSATDSEVIAHLIAHCLETQLGANPPSNPVDRLSDAVRSAVNQLQGTYGIVVLFKDYPDLLIAARQGSPLVLGVGEGEHLVASDPQALVGYADRIVYLSDHEMAIVKADKFRVVDRDQGHIRPTVQKLEIQTQDIELEGFAHYMLKEIYEQPKSVQNTMRGRLCQDDATARFGGLNLTPQQIRSVNRIVLTGCGTSWHACLMGEYVIEELARIPVEVEYASELRYRNPPLTNNTLLFALTQSGETADTLAALREMKRKGHPTLAICNVVGSTIAQEADGGMYLHAGPEIGVASTKAYTSQCISLVMLALYLGRLNHLSYAAGQRIVKQLMELPDKIEQTLETDAPVRRIAEKYADCNNFLYLGRQYNFPTSLEGALKLKEISYIHAEGYPAAEMKHGPIALVDEHTPTVFLNPHGPMYEKVLSNMEEIKARGGPVIAVVSEGDRRVAELADDVITVPSVEDFLQPIVSVIPLQLLAYHIAVLRGCDVDKPRNLAKSVTVE